MMMIFQEVKCMTETLLLASTITLLFYDICLSICSDEYAKPTWFFKISTLYNLHADFIKSDLSKKMIV